MNADANSRSLHDWIWYRCGRVSLLYQVVRQSSRLRCEYWDDWGAQARIRECRRGIGFVYCKDGLGDVLQGNVELFSGITTEECVQ